MTPLVSKSYTSSLEDLCHACLKDNGNKIFYCLQSLNLLTYGVLNFIFLHVYCVWLLRNRRKRLLLYNLTVVRHLEKIRAF